MSASCPVAVSHSSSIPEVCGSAAIYFDPLDSTSINQALEQACYSSSLRESLVTAGHVQCARFSWSRCAEDTLNIYKSIL